MTTTNSEFDLETQLVARFANLKKTDPNLTWDRFRGLAIVDLDRVIEKHPGLTDRPDFKAKRAEITRVLNI